MYNRKFEDRISRGSSYTKQNEVSCRDYEPRWAFVLDGGKVSRINDNIAHIVKADASGTVKCRVGGMPFNSINVDGKELINIHDAFDAICEVVGEDSVTYNFGSNGFKLVRNGSKIDKGVDQLSVTILNDLWVDVVIVPGGQNQPNAAMSRYGNLFFSIRTMLNSIAVDANIYTEWDEFLEELGKAFESLKEIQAEIEED